MERQGASHRITTHKTQDQGEHEQSPHWTHPIGKGQTSEITDHSDRVTRTTRMAQTIRGSHPVTGEETVHTVGYYNHHATGEIVTHGYSANHPYWAEEAARYTPEENEAFRRKNTNSANYRPWGPST